MIKVHDASMTLEKKLRSLKYKKRLKFLSDDISRNLTPSKPTSKPPKLNLNKTIDIIQKKPPITEKKLKLKQNYVPFDSDLGSFQEKQFISLSEKISTNPSKIKKKLDNDKCKPNFSYFEISQIVAEMEKPIELRNLDFLDENFQKIYYFKKFSRFFRRRILKSSVLFIYQQNHEIFKLGDVADYVYIILKGAVSIQLIAFKNLNVIIKTLYDGEHFGDLNVNNSNQRKRQATCFCAEESFLIGVPQNILFEILVVKSEKMQGVYTDFLRGLPIFERIDTFAITSLANNMPRKIFKYGEKIIRQGDKPKSMGIIYKGSCLVVEEREITKSIFASEFQTRLKGINLINRLNNTETNYYKKAYDFKTEKNQYTFTEYKTIKKLKEGDIFCGFTLLKDGYQNFDEEFSEEATYSVIADELNVEIWFFEDFLLNYLAKSKLNYLIFEAILKYDLPNKKNGNILCKKENSEWANKRKRILEYIYQDHYNHKQKIKFELDKRQPF